MIAYTTVSFVKAYQSSWLHKNSFTGFRVPLVMIDRQETTSNTWLTKTTRFTGSRTNVILQWLIDVYRCFSDVKTAVKTFTATGMTMPLVSEIWLENSGSVCPQKFNLLFAQSDVQSDVSLWTSIGFTQKAQRTAFTRPAITPPKVNRFGWNLEFCERNVGGWPWQTLGAILAVATVWEGAEICFFVR